MAGETARTSPLPNGGGTSFDWREARVRSAPEKDLVALVSRRHGDVATEVVGATMPLVMSVTDQSGEARYPSFKGIMAAKKKPLETRPAQLGQANVTVAKMELPPERAAGRIVGTGKDAVPELVKLLQAEAKAI